jgi:hypothetical protein
MTCEPRKRSIKWTRTSRDEILGDNPLLEDADISVALEFRGAPERPSDPPRRLMRFLIDAHLPPALARQLSAAGHRAERVADLGLADAENDKIWSYA